MGHRSQGSKDFRHWKQLGIMDMLSATQPRDIRLGKLNFFRSFNRRCSVRPWSMLGFPINQLVYYLEYPLHLPWSDLVGLVVSSAHVIIEAFVNSGHLANCCLARLFRSLPTIANLSLPLYAGYINPPSSPRKMCTRTNLATYATAEDIHP